MSVYDDLLALAQEVVRAFDEPPSDFAKGRQAGALVNLAGVIGTVKADDENRTVPGEDGPTRLYHHLGINPWLDGKGLIAGHLFEVKDARAAVILENEHVRALADYFTHHAEGTEKATKDRIVLPGDPEWQDPGKGGGIDFSRRN